MEFFKLLTRYKRLYIHENSYCKQEYYGTFMFIGNRFFLVFFVYFWFEKFNYKNPSLCLV